MLADEHLHVLFSIQSITPHPQPYSNVCHVDRSFSLSVLEDGRRQNTNRLKSSCFSGCFVVSKRTSQKDYSLVKRHYCSSSLWLLSSKRERLLNHFKNIVPLLVVGNLFLNICGCKHHNVKRTEK